MIKHYLSIHIAECNQHIPHLLLGIGAFTIVGVKKNVSKLPFENVNFILLFLHKDG
jgi:hypothetical protein